MDLDFSHCGASELGLHCWCMSLEWVSSLKLVEGHSCPKRYFGFDVSLHYIFKYFANLHDQNYHLSSDSSQCYQKMSFLQTFWQHVFALKQF